jgi:hypothetical protein
MSELLQSKSEAFLDRLRKDLSEAEQRYKDVSSNMEEYVSVRSFLTKELVNLLIYYYHIGFRNLMNVKRIAELQ